MIKRQIKTYGPFMQSVHAGTRGCLICAQGGQGQRGGVDRGGGALGRLQEEQSHEPPVGGLNRVYSVERGV
jgi:hypothetical protein